MYAYESTNTNCGGNSQTNSNTAVLSLKATCLATVPQEGNTPLSIFYDLFDQFIAMNTFSFNKAKSVIWEENEKKYKIWKDPHPEDQCYNFHLTIEKLYVGKKKKKKEKLYVGNVDFCGLPFHIFNSKENSNGDHYPSYLPWRGK